MLELLEQEYPITENDFNEFEKFLKKTLPLEMKEFYLKYNGGQPSPSCVHDENHLFPVSAFYSIEEMKKSLDWFDDESLPDEFKKGDLLAFAYFPGNGNYSLSLRKNDYGKVYFYVLEEKATIYGEWNSFKEFINNFVEDTEE
ncbi:SMI1/KNR4 family protein [Pasteurella sp. PK-2025]|uniref:SMI1/KNR4 family protein n=1 Tax=Pasteurella sp. PK-2025 TaxID=3413133 RepID=UPI003C73DB03